MAGHDAKKTDLPRGMGRDGLVCVWGRASGAGDPIHFFLPEPQLSSDGLRINNVWLPPALNFTLSEGAQSLFLEGTKNL